LPFTVALAIIIFCANVRFAPEAAVHSPKIEIVDVKYQVADATVSICGTASTNSRV
jgi:hypothetical protein